MIAELRAGSVFERLVDLLGTTLLPALAIVVAVALILAIALTLQRQQRRRGFPVYGAPLTERELAFVDDSLKRLISHLEQRRFPASYGPTYWALSSLALLFCLIITPAAAMQLILALRGAFAAQAATGMDLFVWGPKDTDSTVILAIFLGSGLAFSGIQILQYLSPDFAKYLYLHTGWHSGDGSKPTRTNFREDLLRLVRRGNLQPDSDFDPEAFLLLAFGAPSRLIYTLSGIAAILTIVSVLFSANMFYAVSATETRYSPYLEFGAERVPHGKAMQVDLGCSGDAAQSGRHVEVRYGLMLPGPYQITLWTDRTVTGRDFHLFELIHRGLEASGVPFVQAGAGETLADRQTQTFAPNCLDLLHTKLAPAAAIRVYRMLSPDRLTGERG